ncbi:MAG: protein O-mannosyl-transferase family [Flavobacteriales bacterium]
MNTEFFNKWNRIIGWLVFAIATFTYVSTVEPTTSLWDCGEYIATAYKLEIGHPPGAPLFLIIANVFSNLAAGDATQAAYYVNIMSALCSSFTILFLFWTISAFVKKVAVKTQGELSTQAIIMVLSSAAVGALCYTFSDSFWFSSGEGEVYAMSSFFTAVVFWAMMKWEEGFGTYRNDKWIVLIAFLIGLSMGVHMLNLLTIPAMTYIYYFKTKENVTLKGFLLTGVLSIVILGFVYGVFIPQVVNLSGKTELLFVNDFGLPFNSGIIFFFTILIGALVFGLNKTAKLGKYMMNTILLSFTFMLMGFSLFVILVIRSNADTPIDQNNPEDAVGLYSYLKREQYGSSPIISGQHWNSRVVKLEDGSPIYKKDKEAGKYIIKDKREATVKVYHENDLTLFPRLYNNTRDDYIRNYKRWSGYEGDGDELPTMRDNLQFFFKYQIGHMYWRYFMWNFVGRQNDFQARDNKMHGQWISGIDFIDESRVGPADNMPEYLAQNKGRNTYYFLPLIFGLIGLFFHYKSDEKSAWVISLLFFFTGIAILIYLNPPAHQPRERDYAFVGSFYAFAIWVGMGVFAIWSMLNKMIKTPALSVAVTLVSLLAVPVLMASENWDDHDRSGRYTALAAGKNYLNSCEPNALIFTMGDNDTFPLWYLQEVEGYRTDVRVVNLSLLNTDWYIHQLKRDAYLGKAIPGTMTYDQYQMGTRDFALYREDPRLKDIRLSAEQLNRFIQSDNKQSKVKLNSGKMIDYFPTKKLYIPVDVEKVKASGLVEPEDYDAILDTLEWDINTTQLQKREMIILDLIANNNWERPIQFAITISNSSRDYMFLDKYFQVEGMTFKLVPIQKKSRDQNKGFINSRHLYENLMGNKPDGTPKFEWANMNDASLYFDEATRRLVMNYRNVFARLANALIRDKKYDQAIEVLDKATEMTVHSNLEHNFYSLALAEAYYLAGADEKGRALSLSILKQFGDEYAYMSKFPKHLKANQSLEMRRNQQLLRATQGILSKYDPQAN